MECFCSMKIETLREQCQIPKRVKKISFTIFPISVKALCGGSGARQRCIYNYLSRKSKLHPYKESH